MGGRGGGGEAPALPAPAGGGRRSCLLTLLRRGYAGQGQVPLLCCPGGQNQLAGQTRA